MTSQKQSELVQAFHLHQQGRWREAEAIYREILTAEPDNSSAKQLLGAVLVQDGRASEAIPVLQAVLQQEPGNPACLGNLGTAYSRMHKLPEAIECYRRAAALDPGNADVARNLGSVLLKARQFSDAIAPLRRALELGPPAWTVHMNLAIALLKSDHEAEAEKHFNQVLEQQPSHRQALAGLGQILLKQKNAGERAVECWRKLTVIEPENPSIHNNYATALKGLKRFDEAEAACRRALSIYPGFKPALCNLGLILASTGRFEEAREYLRQAVSEEVAQDSAFDAHETIDLGEEKEREIQCVAYCQLAATTNMLGNQPEAHWAISKALQISPDDPESRMMRGFLHLQSGEFEKGWPDYEWRKRSAHAPRSMRGPEWDGTAHPDKTILLHAEQGLGDSIHFIRYAKLVAERVGKVKFLCHKPLARLMRLCPYLDEVIADGEPLSAYDLQIALLSLPAIFQTSLATVPNEVPYLFADEALVEHWKNRLKHIAGFRIGIAWQGNREFANDQFRRVPLSEFRRLAQIPGVQLISLQKGDGTEQLAEIDFQVHTFDDMDTTQGAFMDSAAIMRNIDLVISPCTATPHLAGALGIPVWLAKSFAAEWRWLADDRERNPWYPSMHMFRQEKLGDWTPVFTRMSQKLELIIGEKFRSGENGNSRSIGLS